MTVAKRRRALGPKNASEFMWQTIRDREKARERNKGRVERRATDTSLLADSNRSNERLLRPAPRCMSKPALDLPLRESMRGPDPDSSSPTPMDSAQAFSSCDGLPADKKVH